MRKSLAPFLAALFLLISGCGSEKKDDDPGPVAGSASGTMAGTAAGVGGTGGMAGTGAGTPAAGTGGAGAGAAGSAGMGPPPGGGKAAGSPCEMDSDCMEDLVCCTGEKSSLCGIRCL